MKRNPNAKPLTEVTLGKGEVFINGASLEALQFEAKKITQAEMDRVAEWAKQTTVTATLCDISKADLEKALGQSTKCPVYLSKEEIGEAFSRWAPEPSLGRLGMPSPDESEFVTWDLKSDLNQIREKFGFPPLTPEQMGLAAEPKRKRKLIDLAKFREQLGNVRVKHLFVALAALSMGWVEWHTGIAIAEGWALGGLSVLLMGICGKDKNTQHPDDFAEAMRTSNQK